MRQAIEQQRLVECWLLMRDHGALQLGWRTSTLPAVLLLVRHQISKPEAATLGIAADVTPCALPLLAAAVLLLSGAAVRCPLASSAPHHAAAGMQCELRQHATVLVRPAADQAGSSSALCCSRHRASPHLLQQRLPLVLEVTTRACCCWCCSSGCWWRRPAGTAADRQAAWLQADRGLDERDVWVLLRLLLLMLRVWRLIMLLMLKVRVWRLMLLLLLRVMIRRLLLLMMRVRELLILRARIWLLLLRVRMWLLLLRVRV